MMQSRQDPLSISVFFPAYNDEGTIAQMVANALGVLPLLTDDYEVIVVNDGSHDRTPQVLDELARTTGCLKVIHHKTNQGYGAALRSGFKHARKDLVFYTDGDAQYDVRDLVTLFSLMRDGIDVVNGYKIRRADRRRRKVLGAIYNRLARLMFRVPIRDIDCDFRLMRRRAIERIEIVSSSGVVCVEMIHKLHRAGCTFTETAVQHLPRTHGESQFFTPRRVARTAMDFFALWLKLVALRRFRSSQSGQMAAVSERAPATEEARATTK
jgi:glycosyltransferase involved in cell wall biosynthesis